jgi:hypothetical protein
MNSKRLTQLLSKIERDLVDSIPMAVSEMASSTPAYCLFIWYQDYSSAFTPHIGLGTQKLLESVKAIRFDDPMDKYDMIWIPQQNCDLSAPDRLWLEECEIVENDVENCYALLAEASGLHEDRSRNSDAPKLTSERNAINDDDDSFDLDAELDQEFATLRPFRDMMHRVGDSLRRKDWSKAIPVTENFVVLVGDYMGHWLADDFERCVNDQLWAKLAQSGLLLPQDME